MTEMTERKIQARIWAAIFIAIPIIFIYGLVFAHSGTLDAYGCHSNKALYGTTATRECHTDYLAGQVFTSTTAEYKAYITAVRNDLAACKKRICIEPLKQVTLRWAANTEPDLAGYQVHCGTTTHVYTISVSVANVLTGTVPNLTSGMWFCAVTAFDLSGNISGFSSEVSKVIP